MYFIRVDFLNGEHTDIMVDKLQKILYQNVAELDFLQNEEMLSNIVLTLANIFAAVMHFICIFIFMMGGVGPMVLVNVISVSIYMINHILFIHNRKHMAAGLVISFETMTYVAFSIFFMGSKNNIILYFVLVMIMQTLIPYTTFGIRAVVTIVAWLGSVALVYFDINQEPYYVINQGLQVAYSLFNIQLFFIGAIAELSLSSFLKLFIENYKNKKIIEFENQAHTDTLTGLYNRRYAENIFAKLKEKNDKISRCVAIVDIDDFKVINDRYGHAAGDIVLQETARIMKNSLRKTDIVFRWGGEEFLIVFDNVSIHIAHLILGKLRMNIKDNIIDYNGTELSVTATIGVSSFDPENKDASINNCDNNLYKGKASGKNKVVM